MKKPCVVVRNTACSCRSCGKLADPVHVILGGDLTFLLCHHCCPCSTIPERKELTMAQQPVQPPIRTAPKPAAAPAATATKSRQFSITKWKPEIKNTKRGYFSVTLPSGIIINDVSLHEKDDRRWVNMPSKLSKTDAERYFLTVEFSNREIQNDFQEHVLEALDRHFTELNEQKGNA
jgi:DNA-binding cell septation regulator SpoVG